MRIAVLVVLTSFLGCQCGPDESGAVDGGAEGDGGGGGSDAGTDGGTRPCVNLACQQVACPGGGTTTVTGTVYSPAGNLPLPGVTVYVPNATPAPLPAGVSCDRCGGLLSGSPLVKTESDVSGRFVLSNVPVGTAIPLVIQSGKWRRQITVPVTACTENAITDAGVTRLPATQSEGDMPQMALTTGGADALECLLRKVGIARSEFTTGAGTGRVHLYAGTGGTNSFQGGGSFSSAGTLWNTFSSLSRYDVVFLSCEGSQNSNTKPFSARAALKQYADEGGRVFASHWHNFWIQQGPSPWPTTADFNFQPDLNDIVADVDMTFPQGDSLARWLMNVGASTTLGKVPITAAQHTVQAVHVRRWIYKDGINNSASPTSVQYFSFQTPVEAAAADQCGKVVFSDIHVASGDTSSSGDPFPTGCTTSALSPQEKALAFMLFDITACVEPDIN